MPNFTWVISFLHYLFIKFKLFLQLSFTTLPVKLSIAYFNLLDSIACKDRKSLLLFNLFTAIILCKSIHYFTLYLTQNCLSPYENALQYNMVAMEGMPTHFTINLSLGYLQTAHCMRLLFFGNTGIIAATLREILFGNDNSAFFGKSQYTFKIIEKVCNRFFGYSPNQHSISGNIQKLTLFLINGFNLAMIFLSKLFILMGFLGFP